ncbi:MAG: hypothetical protein ABI831_26600, partial [Betaproteobacteria bacterium]
MTRRCFACGFAGVMLSLSGIGVAQEPTRPGLRVAPLGPEPYIFDTAEQHRIRVSVFTRGLSHP